MKKNIQMSESVILAVVLTLSGGFMDAYSYICRGEVFANAQTGNMLLFGVHLSMGEWAEALCYMLPVIGFMLGIAVATFIHHRFKQCSIIHWRQLIVFSEAIIFLIVAFIPQPLNLLANSLISFACGTQVQSFRKVNGSVAATTMCIGNLRTATQSVCEYFFENDPSTFKKGMMFYGIILIFILGAILGNLAVHLFAEKAIITSTVFMLTGFILMHPDREKSQQERAVLQKNRI